MSGKTTGADHPASAAPEIEAALARAEAAKRAREAARRRALLEQMTGEGVRDKAQVEILNG